MATASTVPTVKAALVSQLAARAALAAVPVSYGWLGVATKGESISLDPPEDTHTGGSRIPTMKAGRKAREEEFTVVAAIQVVQGGGNPRNAATTEARAFALLAELDGLLADDPGLGGAVAGPTLRCVLADYPRLLFPFEAGWYCRIDAVISVAVRLS